MIKDRLLRACRRQEVDRSPVWMMRQAGRYLPGYEAIRRKTDFLTLRKTPDLAAEISLLPYRTLGVDAVIIYSDLLFPAEAMGMKLRFVETRGLLIENPVRAADEIARLVIPDPLEKTGFVMKLIRLLRQELAREAPLIGFAAAPYTLACHMIEGLPSRSMPGIKRMMFSEPAMVHRLLDKISWTITDYLNAQIEAGAEVIQLFDTLAGELSPSDYEEFALPYQQRVMSRLHRGPEGLGIPAILYINGCGGVLEQMAKSGANVLSLDWRVDIEKARRRLDEIGFENLALQGNLDPCALLGSSATIVAGVRDILIKTGPTGHIMNLGGAVLPETPVENAVIFVETAKAGIKEAA